MDTTTTEEKEIKEIVSRLKFIGKIQKGEKINVKHMFTQQDGITTKFSRTFINMDTRANALQFITSTVMRAFDLISKNLQTKKLLCTNIVNDIRACMSSIPNLKDTYSDDKMYGCEIETLLQDMHIRLQEIDNKLKDHIIPSKMEMIENDSD